MEERLLDLETMLRADVSKGRLAVGALLGDARLRVYPNGRIEGTAILSPNESRRPQIDPEAASFGGSGGRIRTYDLRVMSPPSYQTAPPRNKLAGGIGRCLESVKFFRFADLTTW